MAVLNRKLESVLDEHIRIIHQLRDLQDKKLAEADIDDESGLSTWWICRGAKINRFVFDVPTSEQALRLQWMKEQRLLYRLVLGQPNQEDLVEILSDKLNVNQEDFKKYMIGLSAWFDGK